MFQFEKIAVFVFIPLYLQEVMKETPIDAGIVVVLAVLPTLITSYLAGKAADRFGSRRPLAIGLLLNGTALILVGLATTMNSYGMIVAPLVVWGATLPFIAVCSRRALMGAVPKAQQGQAGGVNLTIQMLGGTFGMALCGTFLVATGDYRSLFVMTGVLILAILLVAWMTIERGTEAPDPIQ
jgi:MFS family permease